MLSLLVTFSMIPPVVVGLVFFRQYNAVFIRIFFQVAFGLFVIELLAFLYKPNHWIYNIQIPIETGLLLSAAMAYLGKKSKTWLLILFGVFFLIYLVDVLCISGLESLCVNGYVASGIVLVITFLYLIYTMFIQRKLVPVNTPLVIVSLAIVIYFGCLIPYISLSNYLNNHHPELNKVIYYIVVYTFGILRYLLLAIAFIIAGRSKPIAQSN